MVDAHSGNDQRQVGCTPHLDRDLCRDLLHGLLPSAEEEMAITHLVGCPACERLLQEMVTEREKLRAADVARRQSALPARHVDNLLGRLWATLTAGFRRPAFSLTTAAVATVSILLVVLWPRPDSIPLPGQLQWLPTAAHKIQLRNGAETIANQNLAAGLEAYADRDLDRAVELLTGAEVSGPLDTIRRIYLGSALARNGAYKNALTVLQAVAADPLPDPWRCETLWTLYVVLREAGRDAAADSLLRALAREPLAIGDRARAHIKSRAND